MLGSLSELFSKTVDQPLNTILGLGGLTKYIFLFSTIAATGGIIPGFGEFFHTVLGTVPEALDGVVIAGTELTSLFNETSEITQISYDYSAHTPQP